MIINYLFFLTFDFVSQFFKYFLSSLSGSIQFEGKETLSNPTNDLFVSMHKEGFWRTQFYFASAVAGRTEHKERREGRESGAILNGEREWCAIKNFHRTCPSASCLPKCDKISSSNASCLGSDGPFESDNLCTFQGCQRVHAGQVIKSELKHKMHISLSFTPHSRTSSLAACGI